MNNRANTGKARNLSFSVVHGKKQSCLASNGKMYQLFSQAAEKKKKVTQQTEEQTERCIS